MSKQLTWSVQPMYRAFDGTIYAYWCLACGSFWKIYQSEHHKSSCLKKVYHLKRNSIYWVNKVHGLRGQLAKFVRLKNKNQVYMCYINGGKRKSFLADVIFQKNLIVRLEGAINVKI